MLSSFWSWYERHEKLVKTITAVLFVWQLVHLYWMAADIVAPEIFHRGFWPVGQHWNLLLAIVDYTEIPALISATILYINEIRQGKKAKGWIFIILLNSQWLHLFWITDEFVIGTLRGVPPVNLPAWLAIVALLIDYLELPVIYDTLKQMVQNFFIKKPSQYTKVS